MGTRHSHNWSSLPQLQDGCQKTLFDGIDIWIVLDSGSTEDFREPSLDIIHDLYLGKHSLVVTLSREEKRAADGQSRDI